MGLWGDLEILESESTFQKEMGKGGVLACLPCLALWLGQHRVLELSFRVSFTLVSVSFQIVFLGLDLVVWEDGKGHSREALQRTGSRSPLRTCPASGLQPPGYREAGDSYAGSPAFTAITQSQCQQAGHSSAGRMLA